MQQSSIQTGETLREGSDRALIERWRQGEREAGRQLVARHFDTVSHAFVGYGVGAGARARDVFMRIQRCLADFERYPDFEAMLNVHIHEVRAAASAGSRVRSGPFTDTLDLGRELR